MKNRDKETCGERMRNDILTKGGIDNKFGIKEENGKYFWESGDECEEIPISVIMLALISCRYGIRL